MIKILENLIPKNPYKVWQEANHKHEPEDQPLTRIGSWKLRICKICKCLYLYEEVNR